MDTPDVNQALQSWGNVFKTTMETCIPKGVQPMEIPYSEGQSHQGQLSSGKKYKGMHNIEKLKTVIPFKEPD